MSSKPSTHTGKQKSPVSPATAVQAKPHPRDAVDARDTTTTATPDQALLDEALKETFPASDPISPSAAAADGPPEPPVAAPPPSDEPIPFPTADGVAAAKRDGAEAADRGRKGK